MLTTLDTERDQTNGLVLSQLQRILDRLEEELERRARAERALEERVAVLEWMLQQTTPRL